MSQLRVGGVYAVHACSARRRSARDEVDRRHLWKVRLVDLAPISRWGTSARRVPWISVMTVPQLGNAAFAVGPLSRSAVGDISHVNASHFVTVWDETFERRVAAADEANAAIERVATRRQRRTEAINRALRAHLGPRTRFTTRTSWDATPRTADRFSTGIHLDVADADLLAGALGDREVSVAITDLSLEQLTALEEALA